MQVSVESPSAIERKVTVSVEENKIDEAVQSKLQNLTKTVSLKGFRAGKVPINVVKQRYGTQVRIEVLQDVIQSTFYEAIQQEKLNPAGNPNFDPKPSNPGDGLEYTATFEIYPEVAIADITSLEIEKPVAVIEEADMEKMIETIQKQNISWEEADRAAKTEDKASIDFVGTIDGVAFEGGTGNDMSIELGKGQLIPGFEDGIVGMKVGDEKTLDLSFPDTYQKEDLAGKAVQFAVTLKKLEQPVLPEVNEELFKKMGLEGNGMDDFRDEIRSNMQRELDNSLTGKVKQAVMDKLLDAHELDIPKALIENESQALVQQMLGNMQQQGMDPAQMKLAPEMFEGEAKRRVSLGLIMAEIVKQEGITADEAEIKKKVDSIAEPYEHSEQVVEYYYGDKRRLSEIGSMVIEEQVVDWVLEKAKISDKSMTFNEIMYPNGQK